MTTDQAKFILSAYRPGGDDSGNPAFTEAIELTQSEPTLSEWFKQSQAFDSAVASKLAEIQPPAGLRGSILAGARASRPAPSRSRNMAWVAAMAAAVAVLFVVSSYLRSPSSSDPAMAYARFAIADATHEPHHSSGEAAATLVARLQVKDAPMSVSTQVDFEKLKDTGCRTLSFAGHDLVEVCFARDGTVFHLYMMPRGSSPAMPSTPTFVDGAGMVAAVWSDATYDYALASNAGVAALKRLL